MMNAASAIPFALCAFYCLPVAVAGPATRASHSECAQAGKQAALPFQEAVSKDPNVECAMNDRAGMDKTIARTRTRIKCGDDGSDDASICRSTYACLRKAVKEVRHKTEASCRKVQEIRRACAEKNSGQTADLNCADQAVVAGAEANGEIAKSMEDAAALARKYAELSQAVKEAYERELKATHEAEQNWLKKNPGASSDQALLQLTAATAVMNGSLITGPVEEGKAEASAANGGAANLTSYMNSVAKLSNEQVQAASTATRFAEIADGEAKRRRTLAALANVDAHTLENAAKKMANAQTSNSDITGTGSGTVKTPDRAPLPSERPLTAEQESQLRNKPGIEPARGPMADAEPKPDTVTAGKQAGDDYNSYQSNPSGPGSSVSSGGRGAMPIPNFGGGGAEPEVSPEAEVAKPPAPKTPSRIYLGEGGNSGEAQTMPAEVEEKKKETESKVVALEPSNGGFVSGAGDLPGISGDVGKQSGGRSSAPVTGKVKDTSFAQSPRDRQPACLGRDCAAINDLKTTQFNSLGSLGGGALPRLGGGADLSAPSGLDSLFGAPTIDESKHLTQFDKLGVGGIMNSSSAAETFVGGEEASSDEEAAVAARASSLFRRVHSVHERAQKRGNVALPRRKL